MTPEREEYARKRIDRLSKKINVESTFVSPEGRKALRSSKTARDRWMGELFDKGKPGPTSPWPNQFAFKVNNYDS